MDRGAHFYRCDFQVHTPRDTNWSANRPVSDDDRAEFADRLVAACRQKGIGAIAVTDHHDFAFFPFIKQAARTEVDAYGEPVREERRLVVFPGLELTLGVPCQALLILDADFPTEWLSTVLEALAITPTDPRVGTLPPVQRLDDIQSFEKLREVLDRHTRLHGTYIILPNVTDRGHGSLMRKGMQAKYKDMPCVGGYLDGDVSSKVGAGNRRIFAGNDPNWGSKRIALFQTSDSRSGSFDALGLHSTWVKWAAPTAEALRQACLAQESRVAHEAPAIPSTYLTRLSVSNSRFMGPIELELNPQYNAIIGGRGTGKSTCLEYIRWALCDQPVTGAEDDELSDHEARRARLIATTLASIDGSHVDVHFLLNGIRHVVRRHPNSDGPLLKVGEADFVLASEDDVRSLLPVHAYSQKQLSSVSLRLDEVTRFVTAPIRGQLDEIAAEVTNLAGRTRENYAIMQRQRDLLAAVTRDELAVTSLLQQAANLRESLGAISEEDRECLAEKPGQDAADEFAVGLDRKLDQASAEASRHAAAIDRLRTDLRAAPTSDLPGHGALGQMQAAVRSALDELTAAAQAAGDIIGSARADESAYARVSSAWRSTHAAYEQRYQAAKERSATHQSKLDELSEIEERSHRLRESVTEQHEELARLGDPPAEHGRLRAEWLGLHERRSRCIEEQCKGLTEMSGGLIRAGLQRGAGLVDMGARFRAAITGSNVRGNKVDSFIKELANQDNPLKTWEDALSELEPTHTHDPTRRRAYTVLMQLGFAVADIEKIVTQLSPRVGLVWRSPPLATSPHSTTRPRTASTSRSRTRLQDSRQPRCFVSSSARADRRSSLTNPKKTWIARSCWRSSGRYGTPRPGVNSSSQVTTRTWLSMATPSWSSAATTERPEITRAARSSSKVRSTCPTCVARSRPSWRVESGLSVCGRRSTDSDLV